MKSRGGRVRVANAFALVSIGALLYTYWQVHRFVGFGFIASNHDLMMDMAPLRRGAPLLDHLTKGYYTPSVGNFTPGPLYRWCILLGVFAVGLFGVDAPADRVRFWTDPALWEAEPWQLTDYGAATLGLNAVMLLSLLTAAGLAWRWLKTPLAAVAVLAGPLLLSAVNLTLNDQARLDHNFNLPVPVIGPSLIPALALLVAVLVPAGVHMPRWGAAALLAASTFLLHNHLMALPLALFGMAFAALLATRQREGDRWRRLMVGALPAGPMLLRLLTEGPRSFLPNNSASDVALQDGWDALGLHLHTSPALAAAAWLSVIASVFVVGARSNGTKRTSLLGAGGVLCCALLQQTLFFPSWRHYYGHWVEVVVITYLLLLLVVAARKVPLTASTVLLGLVLLLPGWSRTGTGEEIIRGDAVLQRDWNLQKLRDIAEGSRVDVGDDEGLAGIVLYLAPNTCVVESPRLEHAYHWAFCADEDAGKPEVFIRRENRADLDRAVLEKFPLLGSGRQAKDPNGAITLVLYDPR